MRIDGLTLPETLPIKGVYTLIILLNSKIKFKMRKFGCLNLQRGYYAYTGSAMGNGAASLRNRVARHFRKGKTKHWHIDFFLANKNARIVAIVAADSDVKRECEINDCIKKIEGTTVPIRGFGASDCRHNCRSHLVYFGKGSFKEKVANAYRQVFGCCNVLDRFQIKEPMRRVEKAI